MGGYRRIPTTVILPKRPNAEPLVLRAAAALDMDLIDVAVSDLERASKLSSKDPNVLHARAQLADLHSQAAVEMAEIKATVEKICAKPLVDCKKGKKPGQFCNHDVMDQVAELKRLSRIYKKFPEVQEVETLLAKLRPLPGYAQGNQRTVETCQIDLAKKNVLLGDYWLAFRSLRDVRGKSKDDCIQVIADIEMARLKNDPKAGNVIVMKLAAEEFAKKKSAEQMELLKQARDLCKTDPAAARQLYQKLMEEHPLSSAAKLAREEMDKMSNP